MSGHSKWSQIKHKKAHTDAKRGRAFTKIVKEISVAARFGGGDPDGNPRLRTAIENAKEVNMPHDNIKRAIMKGHRRTSRSYIYEEIMYEGYGPSGVALMIEVMTDNKNRTVPEIRHIDGKTRRAASAKQDVFHGYSIKRVIFWLIRRRHLKTL